MGVFEVGWVELLLIGAVVLVVGHERIPQLTQLLDRLSMRIHGKQAPRFHRQTMKNSHHADNDEVIDIEPLPDPPSNAS